MTLDIQFKLKREPIYIRYLHENSNWYKILNRDPKMFNSFVEEVKTNYKLRPSDRLDRALSTFEMLTTILSTFNNK